MLAVSQGALILLLLLIVACAQPAGPPAFSGALHLGAPDVVQAGSATTITLSGAAPDGTPATLIALGSFGPRIYRAAFAGGTAAISLRTADIRHAGVVDLVATAGHATATDRLIIKPGPPADPLVPMVGQRSVVVGGRDRSMAVVIPTDAFGNPVADGTTVTLRVLQPGNRLITRSITVTDGIAWAWLFSGMTAGHTTVVAASGAAFGPEASLREVPGSPAMFDVTATPDNLPADGQQFITLRTSTIRDSFGNILPDGTMVTFLVEQTGTASAIGSRRIPAVVVSGVAEARLQAPAIPGTLTVRAISAGVISTATRVVFTPGPAVGSFPLAARIDHEQGAVFVEARPLLGQLQQHVPDGAAIIFGLQRSGAETQWFTSSASGGRATLELRLAELAPGSYTVEALVGSARGTTSFVIP